MIGSFIKECKLFKVENSVATGQAATVGEIVDTAGFGAACFIYKLGAVTDLSVITLAIYQGSDATVSDVAALAGATATLTGATSGESMLVVDVIKPRERYLRPTLTIATQDSEIDWGVCILYNPDVIPVTQTSALADDTLVVSPAES